MIVVLDTSTVASAIFWQGSTARRCLVGLARRRFTLAVTDEIAAEYTLTCAALRARRPQQNPSGPLAWLLSRTLRVQPAPLGKQRSRDPKAIRFWRVLWPRGLSISSATTGTCSHWANRLESPL